MQPDMQETRDTPIRLNDPPGLELDNVNLAEVKSQGIGHVGPRRDVSRGFSAEDGNLGLKVWPWTVNTVEEADELLKAGADGVLTDFPWNLSEGIGQ